MNVFIDSSYVLSILLKQTKKETNEWVTWQNAYCSRLLQIEVFRTLDRLRLESVLTDQQRAHLTTQFQTFWSHCYRIEMDEAILTRSASAFPTVIATLDALHLSTALEVKEAIHPDLKFLTLDHQQMRAAIACGLEVMT